MSERSDRIGRWLDRATAVLLWAVAVLLWVCVGFAAYFASNIVGGV